MGNNCTGTGTDAQTTARTYCTTEQAKAPRKGAKGQQTRTRRANTRIRTATHRTMGARVGKLYTEE